MDNYNDTGPMMDAADVAWVNQFVGPDSTIPEDAIIEGFIAVISWIDSDGERKWRSYNTIEAPLSHVIGLLEMTKHCLMVNNEEPAD